METSRDYQPKFHKGSSHTHISSMEWLNPHLKHVKRPYVIERDVTTLERNQPVTKILQSGHFKGELENVLKGMVEGRVPKHHQAIKHLQDRVVPVSQIEAARQQQQKALQSFTTPVGSHIIPVNDLRGTAAGKYTIAERHARCKLASLYRVVERMGWTHEIYNHISLRAPGKEENFLINAFGLHYSEVTASNLVKVNLEGNIIDPGSTQLGINKAGYVIHSAIHEARKDIRCIIHFHTPHGAGVSAMTCGLLPLCQEAMIIGGVSYHAYRGIVCDETEKEELIRDLGPVNKVMILHNHGVLAMGRNVEEAYHICCNLMAACEIQATALTAGLNNVFCVNKDVSRKVWEVANKSGGGVSRHGNLTPGELEYEAMMRILDNLGYSTGYPYRLMHLLTPGSESNAMQAKSGLGKDSGVVDDGRRVRTTLEDIKHVAKQIRMEGKRIQKERKQKKKEEMIEKGKYEDESSDKITLKNQQVPIPGITIFQGSVKPPISSLSNTLESQSAPNPSIFATTTSEIDGGTPLTTGFALTTSVANENKGIWEFLDERKSHGPLPIMGSHLTTKNRNPSIVDPVTVNGVKPQINISSSSPVTPFQSYPYASMPSTTDTPSFSMISHPLHSLHSHNHVTPRISTGSPSVTNTLYQDIPSSNTVNLPPHSMDTSRSTTYPHIYPHAVVPLHTHGTCTLATSYFPHTYVNTTNFLSGCMFTSTPHTHSYPPHTLVTSKDIEASNLPMTSTLDPLTIPYHSATLAMTHPLSTKLSYTNDILGQLPVVTMTTKPHSLPTESVEGNHNGLLTHPISSSSQNFHNVMRQVTTDGNSDHVQDEDDGLDLSALIKAKTTAKAVALSTGEAVERLAYHKQQVKGHHQRYKVMHNDDIESSSSSSISSQELNTAKDQGYLKYQTQETLKYPDRKVDVKEYSIVTDPSFITPGDLSQFSSNPLISHQPETYNTNPSSLEKTHSSGSSVYVYTPPKLLEGLTGLEKAVHTAQQVAQSTGVSVEKLTKSLSQNVKKTP